MAQPKRAKKLRGKRDRQAMAWSVALVCLVFTGIVLLTPRKEAEAISQAGEDLIQLQVPQRLIARGEKLSSIPFAEISMKRRELPPSYTPESYLTDPHPYGEFVAGEALPAGKPISLGALSAQKSDTNAVVERIPEGMRAITVRVDAESAVEGWARSGNSVDVILIRNLRDTGSGLQSIVVAENVQILSAGSSAQPLGSREASPKAPGTVTLLVDQDDALKITTASGLGKITFALRGTGDSSPALTRSVDQRRILGGAPVTEQKRESFTGKARGPDGRVYLLKRDSEWIQAGNGVRREVGDVGAVNQE